MTWFKVDDGLPDHPKVEALPPERQASAMWLWMRQGAWCMKHLTDGHVPASRLAREDPADVEALVTVGLWELEAAGVRFHDWLAYQPSADKVRADREANAERMRRIRTGDGAPARAGARAPAQHPNVRPQSRVQYRDPVPSRPDQSLPLHEKGAIQPPAPPARGAARPPTDRQRAITWLTDHGALAPSGYVERMFRELLHVDGVDSLIAAFEALPAHGWTSEQYVKGARDRLHPSGYSNGHAKAPTMSNRDDLRQAVERV